MSDFFFKDLKIEIRWKALPNPNLIVLAIKPTVHHFWKSEYINLRETSKVVVPHQFLEYKNRLSSLERKGRGYCFSNPRNSTPIINMFYLYTIIEVFCMIFFWK